MMRLPSLAVAVGLCAACSQIIGLSDYEKVGGGGAGGATQGKGGSTSNKGGSTNGGSTNGGSTDAEGGEMPMGTGGTSADGGVPGAGGVDRGGRQSTSGGHTASGGRSTGGAPPVLGGSPGLGGAPPGSGGGSACTTVDLLADNGNFDGATIPTGSSTSVGSGWYQNATDAPPVVKTTAQLAAYGVVPLSGSRAAHLGGMGDYEFQDSSGNPYYGRASWVGKVVTIPANATSVTFTCHVRVDTQETATDTQYDFLEIWLYDDALTEPAYTFDEFSNLDSVLTPWYTSSQSVSAADLPAIAGKKLAAELYSFADTENSTDFFVDSCSLVVTSCN